MAVVLALVSALSFGLSDFIGGLVSRRASAWPVAVVVQVSSAISTALIALFVSGSPAPADFGWALLAGAASGVGVGFLFRGLSTGRMSVVAPLSAVGSALVPVVLGFTLGERPGLLVSLAIVAAFPGIWLVASGESGEADAPGVAKGAGVLDGVLAGLGFGVMFAALGQVPDGAGLWPLTVAQVMSIVSVATLAILLKASWRPNRAALRAAPAGPLSAVAVLTFQLATQAGLLTVSSVLASLYPAATVLLAMAVLRERVHATQALGLALCGVTVTLVALG
jgi:drug/metabolite transporter (DMT)-like permease